jgi:hypothetical protein
MLAGAPARETKVPFFLAFQAVLPPIRANSIIPRHPINQPDPYILDNEYKNTKPRFSTQ